MQSIALRAAFAATVLGLGYLLYQGLDGTRRSSRENIEVAALAKAGRQGISWYGKSLPIWRSKAYASLHDPGSTVDAIATIVRERAPGIPCDEAALVRDLSNFLCAWAAEDPDAYLRRLEGRSLRRSIFDDIILIEWYGHVTGRAPPQRTTPRELLNLAWKNNSPRTGRPAAIASSGRMQVLESRPLPPDAADLKGLALYRAIQPPATAWDSPEMAPWMGTFCQAQPMVTMASPTLDEVIAAHARTAICQATMVVRTTTDEYILFLFELYYSPGEQRWHLFSVVNYYPYEVSWPV